MNFKDVKGYEKYYRISTDGEIHSKGKNIVKSNGQKCFIKPKKLNPSISKSGYCVINLTNESCTKMHYIHRLVALTHIENPKNKNYVNHKDGVKTNNNIDNLEWVTIQENVKHALDTGLMDIRGHKRKSSKLTVENVIAIKKKIALGFTYKELAKEYNVSRALINLIALKKTWAWVEI